MQKLALLRFGLVELDILQYLKTELSQVFKNIFTEIQIIPEEYAIPKNALNANRGQYSALLFLHAIRNYPDKRVYHKILGITSLDLFVPQLNFVFGLSEFGSLAKAAVISLFRLSPEFYGAPPNTKLFLNRVLKEGIHEIGHTFGLEHCSQHCIMVYSNSIIDTDKKPAFFCDSCFNKILKRIKL
ncbi:MAG: archaemetzincin family Zn-dependent metalloprotease [Candidatus Helarchaeota archaeon]